MAAPRSLTRRALLDAGWTDRRLAAAVADGRLHKPRPNAYLPLGVPADTIDACAVGGRLTCASELARRGVFVLERSDLHVHLHENRRHPPTLARAVRRHWDRLRRTPPPGATSVEAFDAVLQAIRCQPPRAAVATLDSALHLGILHPDDLDELFRHLPRRHAILRKLADPRAESGPETLVRLILRSLGATFDVQVRIRGVGRVDFVVDGWLIVECDSEAFHSTWEDQRRDRRRDQAAAALGYATYRPIAEDILWRPEEVRAALAGLLCSRSRGRRR
ncbi:very-short-patch-repair endonuclease [Microbacterium immunditiarum]|uniref:Very-short-patch-repair endonuclease n=1 Tax=Microbacterium immunditiarum TaxID=337480 RepID=A0A7Y9GM08_9MICO|nr:very-short-patch-repair endonuclease [Microbacterium immunditiarum]